MKKKALIVVNLAGFLHFLWNDIATLQEMGYEVSVACLLYTSPSPRD